MTYDQLTVMVYADSETMGRAAAEAAAATIQEAIDQRGTANVILATGNSQLTFLAALRENREIDWTAVTIFHMDEYLNLRPGHPAGFSQYLHRNLLDHVPVERFYPVPGHPADTELACRGYETLLKAHPPDLCCLGIGENGHIAFNDPHVADFGDPVWMKVVEMDEVSRRQQVGEGHYGSLSEVPTYALTLTIPALRAASRLLCIVPESRKARAVRDALLGPISTDCPASILRLTPHTSLLLDPDAAAQIV
ncbi:MAG: glucosamine-6-phosphate deaminase [Chloroflexi bacterium]|nr:glucosamine-6-phosphate deaminase [Chloroflexota bacterium]